MGFLTGAFLKIMTGKMKRSLQYRLTSVTLQMNRITKQVGDMEKMLQSAQNRDLNMLKSGMSSSIWTAALSKAGLTQQQYQGLDYANLSDADSKKIQAFNMAFTQQQQLSQQYVTFQQNQIEQFYEAYREAQLEPLKLKEDELATEKANLESRIQLLEGQEKAAQDMEKQGAKDFVPNYTGQG